MKNSNGFTLVELLAVIVILGVLMTIAVPGVVSIMQQSKEKMFCEKVSSIESQAAIYGQDKLYSFETTDGYETFITVSALVKDNYIKNDAGCDNVDSKNCVADPRDKNIYLDNDQVKIYMKNKRMYAEYQLSSADKKLCSD